MINLEKKKSINLTKSVPSLNHVKVGLSWDQSILNGQSPDADASAFMLGENGKIPSDDFFVFFNNPKSGDGAVCSGFHFGNVNNASVRVYNSSNNEVICQYKLTESYDGLDSLVIGRFFRNGTEWEFEAMGQAFGGGLGATVELYS